MLKDTQSKKTGEFVYVYAKNTWICVYAVDGPLKYRNVLLDCTEILFYWKLTLDT